MGGMDDPLYTLGDPWKADLIRGLHRDALYGRGANNLRAETRGGISEGVLRPILADGSRGTHSLKQAEERPMNR